MTILEFASEWSLHLSVIPYSESGEIWYQARFTNAKLARPGPAMPAAGFSRSYEGAVGELVSKIAGGTLLPDGAGDSLRVDVPADLAPVTLPEVLRWLFAASESAEAEASRAARKVARVLGREFKQVLAHCTALPATGGLESVRVEVDLAGLERYCIRIEYRDEVANNTAMVLATGSLAYVRDKLGNHITALNAARTARVALAKSGLDARIMGVPDASSVGRFVLIPIPPGQQ